MQKVVYLCDSPLCGKEIGIKPHVSLVISQSHHACGIAIPNKAGRGPWSISPLKSNFAHFCAGACAGAWFDRQIRIANGETFPEPVKAKKRSGK